MMDFEVTPSRVRTIELENGNKLNLTWTDPYGFIYLSLEHGQLPASLHGAAFTGWREAEQAAQKYVLERQAVVAEIKERAPKKK